MSGKKPSSAASPRSIKYICTFTNTIADVLSNRGWEEVNTEAEEWDFIWADREWIFGNRVHLVLDILSSMWLLGLYDSHIHLESWQRLNHFRYLNHLIDDHLLYMS